MKGWPAVADGATHVGTARINHAPTVAARAAPVPHTATSSTPKRSKYGNTKVIVDGMEFDSAKEARRYRQLKIMEEAGEIGDLQLQVSFVLAPSVTFGNGKKSQARRYVADFTYVKDGQYVVEDVKGMLTEMYKFKRHLMKWVHEIDIKEVK